MFIVIVDIVIIGLVAFENGKPNALKFIVSDLVSIKPLT